MDELHVYIKKISVKPGDALVVIGDIDDAEEVADHILDEGLVPEGVKVLPVGYEVFIETIKDLGRLINEYSVEEMIKNVRCDWNERN